MADEEIINLYKILGIDSSVCQEQNCDEIIATAYRKKAKMCHPDKYKNASDKKKQDMEDMFTLLTKSYKILSDTAKRQEYNIKLDLQVKNQDNDFYGLKKQSQNIMKSFAEEKIDDSKMGLNKENFEKFNDKKPVEFRDDDVSPMDAEEAVKRLNELSRMRHSEENDLMPHKIFENEFDNRKFHAVFDKINGKRHENEIVPHQYDPYSNFDKSNVTFADLDNFGSLYLDDNGIFDDPQQHVDITKEILDSIEIEENMPKQPYFKDMKKKLHNIMRENDDLMKNADKYFTPNDFAGYGIFEKIGLLDNSDTGKKFLDNIK